MTAKPFHERQARKLYIPPTLIAYCLVLMSLFFFLLPQLNLIVFPWNLSGLVILYFGLHFLGKARDQFAKNETTRQIKTSGALIQEGPFAFSRNPMYLFMSVMILGLALLSSNVLSLALPLMFLLVIRLAFIPKEEILLQETFGKEFEAYKKKVRRWF